MGKIVKFKKSMKCDIRDETLVHNVVKDVREQLGDEKKLEKHKYDVQMLIDICNCVEKNASKKEKKKLKCNKKDVVLKVFSELYAEIDLDLVDASIETILNNNLVKKYDLACRVYRSVRNFFLTD